MNGYQLALELQEGCEVGLLLDRGSFSVALAGTLRHKGKDRYVVKAPSGVVEFALLHVKGVSRSGEHVQIRL